MVDVSKFITRAEEAYRKRNYQYAIQMYLEALEVDPRNVEARRTLRQVLLKVDETGEKIQAPKGTTIMLSRDPEVLVKEYEKAVVKEPKSAKYNMRVADALSQLGAHEAAGFVYQFIITSCEKGGTNIDAMKKGAQAFIDAGRPDAAQQLLTRAMRAAPNDREIADLQRNLAASSTLSNIQNASGSYAMLANAEQAAELELLKKNVLSIDEVKRALAIVNGKLQNDPTDKAMVKKKADLFGKAKNFDKAYDWLMSQYEVLDRAPDILELAVRYKNQYFDHKVRVCRSKAEKEPEQAEAYMVKAEEFKQAKREFELEQYQRQVDESPADTDKRFALGQALFNIGRHDDAVQHLQRALKSPKLEKRSSVLLGQCFNEMNRLELAAMQLETAREKLDPASDEELYSEVRYWLGDVYEKQGRGADAKALFQALFMENAAFRDVGNRLDNLAKAS
ncbi:MAG: tetratricopeptide repeat protein [Planctomycetes bacterium]|nr:tetratricopeptide repeat protein [Planctomycetota bacterium]